MSVRKDDKHKDKLARLATIFHKEHVDQTYGAITIKLEAGQIVAVEVKRNIKLKG